MEIHGYIKSNIKLPNDGLIYFPENIKILRENIYENFIDSYGNNHAVLVNVKKSEYIFKDEDISIEYRNDYIRINHKPTLMLCRDLQFNLNKYYIFDNSLESDYMFSKNFFDYNKAPAFFDDLNKYYDGFKESEYFPIFEKCSNPYHVRVILNYIPDRIFFNFPNRIYALERISEWSKKSIFSDVDYVNMTDIQLLKFMNDRFKKRLKFEQFLESRSYLLTNN